MIEQTNIEHHIQKHIIGVLIHQQQARFRDLRPPRTDTNLFSYHLKLLQKAELVEKREGGYTLTSRGLAYADRVSLKNLNLRTQPKLITMTALFNRQGQVLLQRRTKQPYIDTWTLPYGKLHIDDETVELAAQREVEEKLGLKGLSLIHAGDCYIRVRAERGILSSTLTHVFRGQYDGELNAENVLWTAPNRIGELPLAPAVEPIVRAVQSSERFFTEITQDWRVD